MTFEAQKLRQSILRRLSDHDGELAFDLKAQAYVVATVEVAAHIKNDDHAALALEELVRIMIGLEAAAPRAGAQLREIIGASKNALGRFAQLKSQPTRRFRGFTDTKAVRTAPKFGAAAGGLQLRDLLPPGQGRRTVKR